MTTAKFSVSSSDSGRLDCEDDVKFSKKNGYVTLSNPNFDTGREDILYHFALSTKTHDFQQLFGDVKFVCVGGSSRRMEKMAYFMAKALELSLPKGQKLMDIASGSDRYVMYKVGPVLCVSHGMGIGSFSIMMHELIKLLHHAKVVDVCIFRLGTSGGLGLKPGSVVISKDVIDALFRPYFELHILGKSVTRPVDLDKQLADDLISCSNPQDEYEIVHATTMCSQDFYEGQGRLDGAFCEYTPQEKMSFLREAHNRGVRNIEMESLCFAAMCRQANLRGAVICVILLDRLFDDQVSTPKETLRVWEKRPAEIVARYIQRRLNLDRPS